MDDIKIVIDNLSEKDKKELYEYLKNIINLWIDKLTLVISFYYNYKRRK